MSATKKVASVGLRTLEICPRLTAPGTPAWVDVTGATDASFKMAVSEVEQWGNDVLIGTFYHSQKGTISAKASFQTLAVIEQVSGNTARSSAGVETIDIGTAAELTPPRVSVRATVKNARLENGNVATVTVVFYNCSVKTAYEDIAMSLGKLQEMSLSMNTYVSSTDEAGAPLTNACYGRIDVQ
jgi:hypothetical protein